MLPFIGGVAVVVLFSFQPGRLAMRWRGLAKAGLQIRFTAIVYNIKRCSRILAPA